jgi:hypothetical protein
VHRRTAGSHGSLEVVSQAAVSFGACSSGMQPRGLTQELLCRQLVSVRCPGVGAATRNLTLAQVSCGNLRMLGSHLQFDGGPFVQASNLRTWITHVELPVVMGTGLGAYDADSKV